MDLAQYRPARYALLLILALTLPPGIALAQGPSDGGNPTTPPPQAAQPSNTSPSPQAEHRLVGDVKPPITLGQRFSDAIGAFNGAVAQALFFDLSFGSLQHTVTDDQGNPVYPHQPVYQDAPTTEKFIGQKVDDDGKPMFNRDGSPTRVTVQPGSRLQEMDASGAPVFTTGEQPEALGPQAPFLVVFLAAGAIFYTFWHGFINVRGFKHAVDIVCGRYSNKDDPGDIPPFRALTSALSATVGLGNIAGVSVAMFLGGAGALFWMMVLGLFGMTAKFHETTLAQMFRQKNEDGSVSGGPMFYLDKGLRQKGPGFGVLGKVLAVVFAIFTMAASLGGGNMFQSNQAFEGFYSQFVATPSLAQQAAGDMSESELRGYLSEKRLGRLKNKYAKYENMPVDEVRSAVPASELMPLIDLEAIQQTLPDQQVSADQTARAGSKRRFAIGFGILLATLVAIVIIGGITRIGAATSRIVPTMCLLYVFGCLVVIAMNYYRIPDLIGLVFQQAFAWDSAYGGLAGVLIVGFQRAAFSSEAGLGSSAIAHSAAQSAEPVREGFVASLEPFIDTIIICFLTGMTVLVTNAYIAPQFDTDSGTAITLYAFQQTGPLAGWFPDILAVSIILFAFSTMISWCYYGERGWQYLFGLRSVIVFRVLFVACVFIGAIASLGPVINFADLMLLSMALPNIIGGVILAPLVKRKAREYWARYAAGEMQTAALPADTYEI